MACNKDYSCDGGPNPAGCRKFGTVDGYDFSNYLFGPISIKLGRRSEGLLYMKGMILAHGLLTDVGKAATILRFRFLGVLVFY